MKIITNGYPADSPYETPNAIISSPPSSNSSKDNHPHDILILSTLAGRVDQGLGVLHELLRESLKPCLAHQPPIRLWLLSEQSLSFLLHPGASSIRGLSSTQNIFTQNIGILPIYGAATISTKGMEWDVQDWKTEMGGMVSTSNHVLEDEVEIVTDRVVLFTIERVRRDGD
jgi:thiamine pyrophosphokinase